MITDDLIIAAAKSHVSAPELRAIIDHELTDCDYETSELRLMLAADLLCDAALEVVSDESGLPKMSKVVILSQTVEMPMSEMTFCQDLQRAVRDGEITKDEIQALLLRSSVSNMISNALDAGEAPEDLAGATVQLSSLRLNDMLAQQSKPKGLFRRIFGRL
ncbi:hypothetical protein [Thalassobius sp. I31.1]|uniref:hypothetical protein n=1 Tax=Thalassobius sp. I31.1 TaxID=2109912 RepID=UPI000D1BB43E|nr:hypothetical protein [Thalassobius sp. I31.1]